MELNGALSNPKAVLKFWDLHDLTFKVLNRKRAPRKFKTKSIPRTGVPVLATITQVLFLANNQPMRVKDIHTGCQELLGHYVPYRAVKNALSHAAHRQKPRVVRWERGVYRLGFRPTPETTNKGS